MKCTRSLKLLITSLALASPAPAVVIQIGNGSGNTTAPVDDPGFANVGQLLGASMVYIRNGWVLSASHVVNASTLPATVSFNGMSYGTNSTTFERLTNGGTPGLSEFTDLVMFQLTSWDSLAEVQVASTVPSVLVSVVMAGAGRDREASLTSWDVDTAPDPDVWTEVSPPPADREGYKTLSSRSLRWGTNTVESVNLSVDTGNGDVVSFSTDFDESDGTSEAHAVVGDSGGGVFAKNLLGDWELVGIMHAVSTFNGQPSGANTAVFGNQTFSADLSFYSDQINAISSIPEPSAIILIITGMLFFCQRRQR